MTSDTSAKASGFSFANLDSDALNVGDTFYRATTQESSKLSPDYRQDEEQDRTGEDGDWEQVEAETTEVPLFANPNPRHYSPRTCRICLEVVQPTFETPSEGITSMFEPTPKVAYNSEDPADGRLIRPCLCKGSGRYVHEGCLGRWRTANLGNNLWQCPTCNFKYRLARLRWARWISSTIVQLILTISILLTAVFLLGFVADPIINLYLDPVGTISSPFGQTAEYAFDAEYDEEEASWVEHFLKGIASLGLLGFIKSFVAMSPFQWFNLRNAGVIGGRARRGGTGRERLENISWTIVLIGIVTFLYTVWRLVRSWSQRTLERAADRVVDVQGDDDGDEEDEPAPAMPGDPNSE